MRYDSDVLRYVLLTVVGIALAHWSSKARADVWIYHCVNTAVTIPTTKGGNSTSTGQQCFWDEYPTGGGSSGHGGGGGGAGSPQTANNNSDTANSKKDKHPCPDGQLDPVTMHDGNKIESSVDFAMPGEMGLKFERFYISRQLHGSTIYGGWTDSLDYELHTLCSPGAPGTCSQATFIRPDGSELTFSQG